MANVVTIEGYTFELPWVHFAVMGKAGSGKSRLIATMPKPLVVLATDPPTKLQPYFDQGTVDLEPTLGPLGQKIWLVKDADGKVIIQVEGFYDTDPEMLDPAMTKVVARFALLAQEVKAGMWKSAACDSWSGLEDMASYRRLKGPMAAKAGGAFAAHRGVAREDCQSLLVHIMQHLQCNLGLAFHVTRTMEEDGGEMRYTMDVIGKFANVVERVIAERYHSEALTDGVRRQLRTRPDGRFNLTTCIDAPDPCDNTFGALFANMIAKKLAAAKAAEKKSEK